MDQRGPAWLAKDPSCWPTNDRVIDTKLDERPTITTLASTTTVAFSIDDWLQRFSSMTRFQRITAWILRVARNCRLPKADWQRSSLTVTELHEAVFRGVRLVQETEFAVEIRSIRSGADLLQSSKLKGLNPFLDEQGILRVGGRLRHAAVRSDAAHPAILSGTNHLTTLIIAEAHLQLLHGGAQMMQNYIRQRFWIIGIRGRLRKHVHGCMICFRQRPRCGVQQMGDLPEVRVTPSRPFSRSGVDYAGPMAYKSRAGRGARTEKGYVSLFVCLVTKAVHLEFVSDLTAAAFITAFRRFVARRGKCSELLSDNATNFVGAKRVLGDVRWSTEQTDDIARMLANDGTNWRMIPPRSPHFGGLWEAGVKSVKHHLRRIVGDQLLTFEEFTTTLAEIEAILNSRPLSAMSDDPNDYTALTPGHFLVGDTPLIVPHHDIGQTPSNRLARWQLTTQITQHFWRRWQREYLSTLQQRHKWTKSTANVTIGQLVLLRDDLLPPTKWKLARVTGTRPGHDGRVRVVELKHATGHTTRAITQICALPIDSENT